MKKRILAIVLTLIMLCTIFPLSALADEGGGKFNSEGFYYVLDENDNAVIVGYVERGESYSEDPDERNTFVIPAELDGHKVIGIGDSAFKEECSTIISVTLPEGLEYIGDHAFYGCRELSELKLPKSLTSIGDCAFCWCSSLEELTIPAVVTEIGDCAFENCRKLRELNIPGGVTKIGDYTFDQCESLQSVVIPEGVTSIGLLAFNGCFALANVKLPSTLTEIDAWAFHSCQNFTAVTIPAAVKEIEQGAFAGLVKLKSIKVESGSQYFTTENGILYNKAKTELVCVPAGISGSVTIPGTVKTIAPYAIEGCGSITSLTIPKSVTNIGFGAVNYCDSLKNVYYKGSSSQWQKVKIGDNNYSLSAAKMNYDGALSAPVVKTSNVASSGKIKLTWDKVDGAVKYEVYRADTRNGTYKKMLTTTNTSYTNTSSNAGYAYYYKVRAVDKNGKYSSYSDIVSRTCDCAAPVVTGSNDAKTGKVKLSWGKVTGAAKYEIWRATSKNGSFTRFYTTTSTSYTNTTSYAGYTYYYKVKAIASRTENANSDFSSVVSRTCDCAAPVVKITLNKGEPKLTWEPVYNADSYTVYRATSKNGTYSKMLTTSNTSYTNTTAKADTTYYYKVLADSNKSGYATSAYSSVVSIKVPASVAAFDKVANYALKNGSLQEGQYVVERSRRSTDRTELLQYGITYSKSDRLLCLVLIDMDLNMFDEPTRVKTCTIAIEKGSNEAYVVCTYDDAYNPKDSDYSYKTVKLSSIKAVSGKVDGFSEYPGWCIKEVSKILKDAGVTAKQLGFAFNP